MRIYPFNYFSVVTAAISCLVHCGSAATQPTVEVGTLPGDIVVDNSGQASYSVPIKVPDGIGGVQPELSITYAGGGNGPLGIGWSLSGLSAVSRGAPERIRDGVQDGIRFDAEGKYFYLDGQRLLRILENQAHPIYGNYDEYRTEIESFSRVRAYHNEGTSETPHNPYKFEVETKSGLKMIYGATGISPNSQTRLGNHVAKIMTWHLCKVIDTTGNQMEIRYHADDDVYGMHARPIDRIIYGKNTSVTDHTYSVVFEYEDRPDSHISYFRGHTFQGKKRLLYVSVLGGKDTQPNDYIWRYELRYIQSPVSQQSLLKAIGFTAKKDQGAHSFPDTIIRYSSEEFPEVPQVISTYGIADGDLGKAEDGVEIQMGDANGDGVLELYKIWTDKNSNKYNRQRVEIYEINAWDGELTKVGDEIYNLLPDLKGIIGEGKTINIPVNNEIWRYSDSDSWERSFVADFNSDGISDILVFQYIKASVENGGNANRNVYFRMLRLFQGKLDSNLKPSIGEGNIGGYTIATDEFIFDGGREWSNNFAEWSLNDGDHARLGWELVVSDFDGDALPEIMHLNISPGENKLWGNLFEIDEVEAKAGLLAFKRAIDDSIVMHEHVIGSSQNGGSSGAALDSYKLLENGNVMIHSQALDFDADGNMDIALVYASDKMHPNEGRYSRLDVFTGIGTEVGVAHFPNEPTLSAEWAGWTTDNRTQFADFNGDGLQDAFIKQGRKNFLQIINTGTDLVVLPMQSVPRYTENYYHPHDMMYEERQRFPAGYDFNLQDINYDGRVDCLLRTRRHNGGLEDVHVYYADGSAGSLALTDPVLAASLDFLAGGSSDDSWPLTYPYDCNNDGHPDFITISKSTSGHIDVAFVSLREHFNTEGQLPKLLPVDRILSVKNGLGSHQRLEYGTLADPNVYVRGSGAVFPIIDVQGPMPVVTALEVDAGGVDTMYRTEYTYGAARMDLGGRGFLGFQTFASLDTVMGVFKVDYLHQAFPMTGQVIRSETYQAWDYNDDGQIIDGDGGDKYSILSLSENVVTCDMTKTAPKLGVSVGTGALFPMVTRTSEWQWEFEHEKNVVDFSEDNFKSEIDILKNLAFSASVTDTYFDDQDQNTPPVSGFLEELTEVYGDGNQPGAAPSEPIHLSEDYFRKELVFGNMTKVLVRKHTGTFIPDNSKTSVQSIVAVDFVQETHNIYESDNSDDELWILGRLQSSKVMSKIRNAGVFSTVATRSSAYEYDSNTGLLTKEIVEPSIPATKDTLLTEYERTSWGAIAKTTVTGAFGDFISGEFDVHEPEFATASRVTEEVLQWDQTRRYPYRVRNALGHEEITEYDPHLGLLLRRRGPNGIARATDRLDTSWEYDALGRTTKEMRPDGTYTSTKYEWADAAETEVELEIPNITGLSSVLDNAQNVLPPLAKYKVTTTATASPTSVVHYDRIGRELRSETLALERRGTVDASVNVAKNNVFNSKGQTVAVSEAYYLESSSPHPHASQLAETEDAAWSVSLYDELGRVSRTLTPYTDPANDDISSWIIKDYMRKGRISAVMTTLPEVAENTSTAGLAVDVVRGVASLHNVNGDVEKTWNSDRYPKKESCASVDSDAILADTTEAPSVQYIYDPYGNAVKTISLGQTSIQSAFDTRGEKIWMQDPDMGSWLYYHDALGQLRKQVDAEGQWTSISYDDLGRIRHSTVNHERDPGIFVPERTLYYHDGVGGSYDWIGATKREVILSEGLTLDQDDNIGLGQIRHQKAYNYDWFGRQFLELSLIDGKYYYSYTRYDDISRIRSVDYFWRPSGLIYDHDRLSHVWHSYGISYDYNPHGQLIEVSDSAGSHHGQLWWHSPYYDLHGRVLQADVGGKILSNKYDRFSGALISRTVDGVMDMDYKFDAAGNLVFRKDSLSDFTRTGSNWQKESFRYDRLNRLTHIQHDHDFGGLDRNSGSFSVAAVYSSNGNLEWKSDVGSGSIPFQSYMYDTSEGAGPHALTAVKNSNGTRYASIGYDQNGRMNFRRQAAYGQTSISDGARDWFFKWNGFGKLDELYNEDKGIRFTYDASNNRLTREDIEFGHIDIQGNLLEEGHVASRKIYVGGGVMEQQEQLVTDHAGTRWETEYTRIYLSAPTGALGVMSFATGGDQSSQLQRRVFALDHLGSVAAMYALCDICPDSKVKEGYDAWGYRRNPGSWSQKTLDALPSNKLSAYTDRGFTGHEMLDEIGLVHMNGRIYDALLGRFLSPDPHVQHTTFSQSYNRYAYTYGNPLKYADPSGYFLSGLFKSVGNFVKKYWRVIVVVVIVLAVTALTAGAGAALATSMGLTQGGLAASVVSGAVTGAIAGFTGGFAGTLINGGSLGQAFSAGLLGAAIGALTGAAFGAIDYYLPSWSQTASTNVDKTMSGEYAGKAWSAQRRVLNQIARISSRAAVKGLASEMQKGKFASGFWTSAAIDSMGWASDMTKEHRIKYELKLDGVDTVDKEKLFNDPMILRPDDGTQDITDKVPYFTSYRDNTAFNFGRPPAAAGGFLTRALEFVGLNPAEILTEGRWFSRIMSNYVPGMHQISLDHDTFSVMLMGADQNSIFNFMGNWGTMLPTAAVVNLRLYNEYVPYYPDE